jgi:hypothetical protein
MTFNTSLHLPYTNSPVFVEAKRNLSEKHKGRQYEGGDKKKRENDLQHLLGMLPQAKQYLCSHVRDKSQYVRS